MDISGEVVIRLPCHVSVRRPVVAERLFVGQSAGHVMTLVPMLYSLCAQAQKLAAQLALYGKTPDEQALRAVALEAVREHGLYLGRWLPRLHQALQGVSGWLNLDKVPYAAKLNGVAQAIGGPPEIFQAAKTLAENLPEKARKTAPEGVLPLHGSDLTSKILQQMAAQADWCQQPEVDGVRENSFYTRASLFERLPPDAAGRLAARLWDLHQWLRLAVGERCAFPVWGQMAWHDWRLGWVETARGRLYHAARVEAGRVMAYRISAPTEWNFHPRGVLARWLEAAGQADAQTAQALAALVDPCVAVRVEHA